MDQTVPNQPATIAGDGTIPIDAAKNVITVSSPKIGISRRRWTGRIVMGRQIVQDRRAGSSFIAATRERLNRSRWLIFLTQIAVKIDL